MDFKGIENYILKGGQIFFFLQIIKLKVTIYGKNSINIIYTLFVL